MSYTLPQVFCILKERRKRKPQNPKVIPHLKCQYFEKLLMFNIILFLIKLLSQKHRLSYWMQGKKGKKISQTGRGPRELGERAKKIPVIVVALLGEHCPFILIIQPNPLIFTNTPWISTQPSSFNSFQAKSAARKGQAWEFGNLLLSSSKNTFNKTKQNTNYIP